MKRAITFDTNILRQLKEPNKIEEVITKYSDFGEVFVTEIVVDELTEYYLSKIENEITNNLFLFEIIKIEFDNESLKRKTEVSSSIKKYISTMFSKRVIHKNTITIDELYQRSVKKIAPFVKDSSDKGLKDTMIWLSILNHDFSRYDEVVFISKDNSFIANSHFLTQEFESAKTSSFKMFEGTLQFDEYLKSTSLNHPVETIIKKDKIEISNIDSEALIINYQKMSSYRNETHQLLNDIIYVNDSNPYANWSIVKSFYIYTKIEINSLTMFAKQLRQTIEENMLSKDIDPYEVFKNYISREDFISKSNIDSNIIISFFQLISNFSNELSDYSSSFIKTIVDQVNNECLVSKNERNPVIDSDDLPF